MVRGKKKKASLAATPFSSSGKDLLVPCAASGKKYEEQYGNKCVYFSAQRSDTETKAWFKIDPHSPSSVPGSESDRKDNVRIEQASYLEIPTHLDLHELRDYASFVYESKVYIIGGFNTRDDLFLLKDPNRRCSGKMFIYDLNLKTWTESLSKLNIYRYHHVAVIVNHVIYVFGGVNKNMNIEQWIECYDLKNSDSNQPWRILHTPNTLFTESIYLKNSIPPKTLFTEAKSVRWGALYERGNQILFYISKPPAFRHQIFSFNYVTHTWNEFDMNIVDTDVPIACNKPAVVEDVLFWEWYGTIYGYDLCKEKIVVEYCFEGLAPNFTSQDHYRYYPDQLFLVCAGKDTLVLVWVIGPTDGLSNMDEGGIYCYRFRIAKDLSSSSSQDSSCGLRLVPDGNGYLHDKDVDSLDYDCFVA